MNQPSRRLSLADQIRKGLEESIQHAEGKENLVTTSIVAHDSRPVFGATELVEIRASLKISQIVFADLLNVTPKTVRDWEDGVRTPSRVAIRLIQVFHRNPEIMLQFVGGTATGSEIVKSK